jgi:hypothetical protein
VPRPFNKVSLKKQALEENQLTTAAVKPDPDALPLADEQMSAHYPMRVLMGVERWRLKSSWFLSGIVLMLITISGPQVLIGKLV